MLRRLDGGGTDRRLRRHAGRRFRLPRLKIPGLHDRHHSEAVTLQFIGRFTRSEPNLGDATVIAGVSLEDPREWLNALYREDADCNTLHETGARRASSIRDAAGAITGLDQDSKAIPAETVSPKLNAFVFRTHCAHWNPAVWKKSTRPASTLVEGPIVNEELRLVMAVTRHEDRLRWTRVNHPVDVVYNLVIGYWDQQRELLYVHSYPEDGLVLSIARMLCGNDVELLRGEAVFRVLHGFRRVMLTNLGVKETQVKPIRFQLSTGIDITEQLEATVENRSRIKTNLFGSGYVDEPVFAGDDTDEVQAGKRSVGCSTKGKMWSQEGTVSPDDWIRWCDMIGPKIADKSINTEWCCATSCGPGDNRTFREGRSRSRSIGPRVCRCLTRTGSRLPSVKGTFALSECDLEIAAFEAKGPRGFVFEVEASPRNSSPTFEMVSPCFSGRPHSR